MPCTPSSRVMYPAIAAYAERGAVGCALDGRSIGAGGYYVEWSVACMCNEIENRFANGKRHYARYIAPVFFIMLLGACRPVSPGASTRTGKSGYATDLPPGHPPRQAGTSQELIQLFGERQGFGPVDFAHVRRFGREILVFWYDPFSGRAACYIHVYYYDPDGEKWVLFFDDLLENSVSISVEISSPSLLLIKDGRGDVVLDLPMEDIPASKWYEEE
jgi:hypothetical protein